MNPIVTAPYVGLLLTALATWAAPTTVEHLRSWRDQREAAHRQELAAIDAWLAAIRSINRPTSSITTNTKGRIND